eukprot:GHVQ01036157.1.p1 GENE.GHVQ01036157.1~~GHVQ01036157.1.p1  ORF type:complete len:729 (-),score=137.07 GHVQ01036157.1:396-2582(-)
MDSLSSRMLVPSCPVLWESSDDGVEVRRRSSEYYNRKKENNSQGNSRSRSSSSSSSRGRSNTTNSTSITCNNNNNNNKHRCIRPSPVLCSVSPSSKCLSLPLCTTLLKLGRRPSHHEPAPPPVSYPSVYVIAVVTVTTLLLSPHSSVPLYHSKTLFDSCPSLVLDRTLSSNTLSSDSSSSSSSLSSSLHSLPYLVFAAASSSTHSNLPRKPPSVNRRTNRAPSTPPASPTQPLPESFPPPLHRPSSPLLSSDKPDITIVPLDPVPGGPVGISDRNPTNPNYKQEQQEEKEEPVMREAAAGSFVESLASIHPVLGRIYERLFPGQLLPMFFSDDMSFSLSKQPTIRAPIYPKLSLVNIDRELPGASSFYSNIETNFEAGTAMTHTRTVYAAGPLAVIIYLLIVFVCPRLMRDREPFDLRTPLKYWNLALSVFSFLGTCRVLPHLIYLLYKYGFVVSLCAPPVYTFGHGAAGMWTLLFVYSKFIELLDTAFIILRKKHLGFLHWYHHSTVLMYTWDAYVVEQPAGIYFVTMNYTVHTIMYFYFYLAARLQRQPSWAIFVTIAQIAQMLIGVFVTMCSLFFVLSYDYQDSWVAADVPNPLNYGVYISLGNLIGAMLMYGTYFYLFAKFFLTRYSGGSKNKPPPTSAAASTTASATTSVQAALLVDDSPPAERLCLAVDDIQMGDLKRGLAVGSSAGNKKVKVGGGGGAISENRRNKPGGHGGVRQRMRVAA